MLPARFPDFRRDPAESSSCGECLPAESDGAARSCSQTRTGAKSSGKTQDVRRKRSGSGVFSGHTGAAGERNGNTQFSLSASLSLPLALPLSLCLGACRCRNPADLSLRVSQNRFTRRKDNQRPAALWFTCAAGLTVVMCPGVFDNRAVRALVRWRRVRAEVS